MPDPSVPLPIDEASQVGPKSTACGSDLWKSVTDTVERPAKTVPLLAETDVLVAGGGITGIIAALAAARFGAKTFLVESFSMLGGNMGPGVFAGGSLHLALCNPEAFPKGLGGVPAEFNRRVVNGEDRLVGSHYFRDSLAVATVAARMCEEAGVKVLLDARVADVIINGQVLKGLFVETKSGTLAIRSKVVIDTTGTADVASLAHAGTVEMPENPAMGIFFALIGVDWDRYQKALGERGALSPDDQLWAERVAPGAAPYMPWARQAWEAGEFRIVETVTVGERSDDVFATLEVSMQPPKYDPPVVRCRTRVNGRFHPGDALALSRIEEKMYPYVHDFVGFLNRRVPGFESAWPCCISPYFHARGGKCLDAAYLVYGDDINNQARFDDVIFIFWNDKRPGGTDIPYRMLLPKKVDGLLAAGRSAIKRGAQIRQRHSVQLMGQAAGVAAALAVKHRVQPRQIDVKELQKTLLTLGAELGPPERLRQLGLA